MLHSLSSNLPEFKSASFEPGVNIALAVRTRKAVTKDSRNAVGKSSFVMVLDFLLGSDLRAGHVLRNAALESSAYQLQMDLGDGERITANRSVAEARNVELADSRGSLVVPLSDWRFRLGRGLFGLAGKAQEPSVRSLLAYYLRDVASGGFSGKPTETFRKQRVIDTQPPLAHLFGLDLSLVDNARRLAEAGRSAAELRRATKDPILGITLGRSVELDAELRTLDIQRRQAESRLQDFRVIESYSEQRRRADALSREIRGLNDDLYALERRLEDIEESLRDEERGQPDHSYLARAYEEAGRALPELVLRRLDEVREFHASVVSNRRRYLEAERNSADRARELATARLSAADAERSSIMRLMREGGALETFTQLQEQFAILNGRVSELRHRRDAVDRLENSTRQLRLETAKLQLSVSADIDERRQSLEEIASMFSDFAFEIYGSERPASLIVEPSKTGYSITPSIGGDNSQGVGGIVMFCFDLTMSVIAHRAGRGPDFLVHDSHLYDSIEARQVGSAIRLANQVAEREGLQYVMTMNSDALDRARAEGPAFSYHQCLTLTDEYGDGGLFGLRFN